MSNARGSRESFVIRILDQQHSSWQGTITQISDQQTQPFRSALELIKLIDNTLTAEREAEEAG